MTAAAVGEKLREKLHAMADPAQAVNLSRFFKTGPGEYAEGDRFIGVRVPQIRKLVKVFAYCPVSEIRKLLKSPIHEERLLALLLLVQRYRQGGEAEQERIYRLYLASMSYINNWDLVDASAEHIVGAWLFGRAREPLYQLAVSPSLWERRTAMLATFYFIKQGEFSESLSIAECLLSDTHDLIHKAVGWMLREVGKRDQATEEAFLKKHYQNMPRTMLRYAIERFPEHKRQAYLKGRVKG
jgi:3-methyladenine DNA glycosylase AlkD